MNRIGKILIIIVLFIATGFVTSPSGGDHITQKSDSVYIYSKLNRTELNRLDSVNRIYDPCGVMDCVRRGLSHSAETSFVIAHIGDSHIVSGFWSDHFRKLMQSAFGSAGRGLIVPFGNSSIYEDQDYSVTSPQKWITAKLMSDTDDLSLGVGGYAFETCQSEIVFKVSCDEYFDRVRIFCHTEAPRLEAEDSLRSEICCPDERLDCVTVALRKSVKSVELRGNTIVGFQRPIYYAMSLENGDAGVLYHAVGVIGVAMEHYNQQQSVIAGTKNLNANLTIVSLGTNESFGRNFTRDYFYNQISTLVSSLREANPQTVIMFTTPMENGRKIGGRYVVNKNVRLASDVLKMYADELGYAVWDWYEISGGQGSMKRWYSAGLMSHDRVHLTSAGYRLQAELLFSALTQN